MWGDDSDEDEETQQVEEKPMEVVKEPEETWTNSTTKTDEPTEEQKAEAATKIQAAQRGKAARKEMQAREEAATKIQAVQRGKMAREAMKQEDVDESGGWGAENDDDKYAQKVEDSYAQKEATKPKPSPRRQQASKETKGALPKDLFVVTAMLMLYHIESGQWSNPSMVKQELNSACWKPRQRNLLKRAA